jgi:nicotinamide-nucleotide amidase
MGERNATLASRLARKLKQKGWKITTAESCTGGMLTSTLTDISGSSEWFQQGWVTYSNESKMNELGVQREKFEGDSVPGAVSKDVAAAMAEGALKRSGADLAISITGIAGPGGGTQSKPVGLAFVCAFWENRFLVRSTNSQGGDRSMNKQLFVSLALETALNVFETEETGTHRLDLRSNIETEEEENPEQLSLKEATLSAFGRVPGMEDTWYGEVIWSDGQVEGTVVDELRKKEDEDIWSEE